MLKYVALLLMAAIAFNSCQKQESVFQFKEKVKPPPPPPPLPPPPPPPLSEDLKNIELVYNGTPLKTSIVARKTFSDTKQASGSYADGFELVIRLDNNTAESGFQQLQIKLPINEKGQVVKGNYIIQNNEVVEGGNMTLIYAKGTFTNVFPDASYPANKDKFNFNLSLRVEDFNATEHKLSGVIDSLKISDATNPEKSITMKEAGFNFYYDFLELYLNDQLMYETTTNPYSLWYPRVSSPEENVIVISGEKLYPTTVAAPFKFGQLTFILSFNQVTPVFTGETVLPMPSSTPNQFVLRSEEYMEIAGKPLYGILPATTYQCRFITPPKMDVSGGMEVSTTNAKNLLEEFYDYNVDPPTYEPQRFIDSPTYKLKCLFYQKKI